MAKKKLTDKQRIKAHNDSVDEYQMRTQGFLGYVYPIKKKKQQTPK